MKARYRYRTYPNAQQKLLLAKTFGCVRIIWNDILALSKTDMPRLVQVL